ncbi:MAG: PepSY domain-containing protein [Clostridia bacterium]|nr:PepSY domain-containing protein [Clostridia bacterium]
MKKLFGLLTIVIVMVLTCLVGCDFANTDATDPGDEAASAAAVFTLDVNPGVRVYVKSDDTVIKVEATNKDGEDIVADIEFKDVNFEAVVEEIIDKMNEQGFLEGEESAVLISVEKKEIEISEKLNEKIDKAFKKHGKKASVIEQELVKLDEKIEKEIGDIAKRYNISEGKAHLIEKIREEFPELPEEELAELKVNDLGVMLEETSEDVKKHFNKVGPAVENSYVGREQALVEALESLEIAVIDITMPRVCVTREDGKMVYEVEFVYDGMEYEITVDAVSGDILETEFEEFEEFDADKFIDDFKNKVDFDEIMDDMINEALGKDDAKGEYKDEHNPENKAEDNNRQPNLSPLSRGEILKAVMEVLGISDEELKKTDVRLHEADEGAVFSVTVETKDRGAYRVVAEAYSGTVLKAEFNGVALEIGTAAAE